jgi:ketosteroid isomerase-like protein
VSAHTSPADLYRHGLRLLLAKDIPGWVGLWAEDGVMEFPFAPQGWPERLAGKAAIAAYMRDYPDRESTRPPTRGPSWSRCAASAAWCRPAIPST